MRDFDQHLIAGRGSQPVIQRLEAIHVEQQERVMEVAIPLCAVEAALQAIEEETAIG